MAAQQYKKLPVVDLDDVPDWQRRQPKWDDLVQDVLALAPGKSLPVLFYDVKSASRARNAVRDRVNRILNRPAVRTRIDKQENGEVVLHLVMLSED